MFLVMGITGKVGGATAEHLLAHGKEVRALVRNREKAANWANQGVELVDGDWNDSAAIEQALKGVEGAFVMLPAVWAPSPDYKEAKGVIANYVEALTKAAPPRVVALSSMGANRTSGLGMITALHGISRIDEWLAQRFGTGIRRDDLFDACACAIAARDSRSRLPSNNPPSVRGIRMEIWY